MKTRYSDRMPTLCPGIISCNGRIGKGHIVNLSAPGCELVTDVPLTKGDCIQLQFPEAHLWVDLAMVRWRDSQQAGIEFIRMTAEDQVRLRTQLELGALRRTLSHSWSEPVTFTSRARYTERHLGTSGHLPGVRL